MKSTHIAWAVFGLFSMVHCANAQSGADSPSTGKVPAAASSSMPPNTGMSQPKVKSPPGSIPGTPASYVTSAMPSNTGMSRHKPKKPGSGGIFHHKEASTPSGTAPDSQNP